MMSIGQNGPPRTPWQAGSRGGRRGGLFPNIVALEAPCPALA